MQRGELVQLLDVALGGHALRLPSCNTPLQTSYLDIDWYGRVNHVSTARISIWTRTNPRPLGGADKL